MRKSLTPNPDPQTLLNWYDRHRRILPWRALHGVRADPYAVWLSEIMLQQTTVATVGPYFQKFLKLWPNVEKLAAASLDDVLRNWAGLGYYRRARGLHDCARQIVADYGGIFPDNEAELLKLPGFGPYTAAAVSAIAFGQRANVVDGNVERVIARIFHIDQPLPQAKKIIKAKAETLLPQDRYGDYAQALMDLGATICVPRNPKCILCPWMANCAAYAAGTQNDLPRRAATTAKPVRRAVAFVVMDDRNRILLRQRPDTGLLAGMMEIPSSDWLEQPLPSLNAVMSHAPIDGIAWHMLPGLVVHIFTHFRLEIAVVVGHISHRKTTATAGKWVALSELQSQALPTLMHKITRHAQERV